jgi:periplasmic mercuric ion binding protein
MKIVVSIMMLAILMACGTSKNDGNTKQTVEIQTNAECGTCKKIIEKELNYVKGITFADLDVPSKVLTVKFNSSKITLEDIRIRITKIGYNADDLKADPSAQSELPACCQPGGMKK